MALFTKASAIVYANPAFYQLTATTDETAWIDGCLGKELVAAADTTIAASRFGGKKNNWLQVNIQAFDLRHNLATITDVTVQQQQINTSSNQVYNLQALIESTPVSVFAFDGDFNYTAFNKAHAANVVTTRGTQIAQGTNYLAISGEDAEKSIAIFEKVMAGETIETIEIFGDPALRRTHFSMVCSPIYGRDGLVQGMGVFCQDITTRIQDQEKNKFLQEDLNEKTSFLEGLLNNLPVILYRIDCKGIVTMATGAGLKTVPNWAKSQLVGMSAFELAEEMVDAFRKAMGGETDRAVKAFMIEGNEFFFDTIELPDNTNPGGMMGFAVDVTATKKAERALEGQNLFKNRVLSIISHDLRQPMAVIATLTNLFEFPDTNLDEVDLPMILSGLNDTAQKSIKLLDGMLGWLKTEQEGFVYEPSDIILKHNLEEACGIYKLDKQKKQISFVNSVPETLVVAAHWQMLLFINRNLVSNSIKYSPDGGKIEVTATINEYETIVTFADEGRGIAAEQIEQLFRPSYSSIENNEGGAGIALSICYDLVERLGGRIWAESAHEGVGSRFCYSLPIQH